MQHVPVMPAETMSLLAVRPEGVYLDATAGLGGHTSLIARQLTTGIVIANDRDAASIEMAGKNTAEWAGRVPYGAHSIWPMWCCGPCPGRVVCIRQPKRSWRCEWRSTMNWENWTVCSKSLRI